MINAAASGQTGKPLSNDDVLAMVKKKLPESVIVSAIKNSPGNYDTSPNELIRLNSAGLTENELNAMMSVGHKDGNTPASANPGSADATANSKWKMPAVTVVQGSSSAELKLEKTQLAQTKNKPTSMNKIHLSKTLRSGVP